MTENTVKPALYTHNFINGIFISFGIDVSNDMNKVPISTLRECTFLINIFA